MNDEPYQISRLIGLQRTAWYFFFAYFVVAAGLWVLGADIAGRVTFWGVVLVLAVTLSELVIIAEQFRVAEMRRFQILSYVLALLLLSTIVLKYFVL
ncbi:MAG: hypothetical protein OEW00_10345 [candidate division Zixibacteria bacterium]|nr:hypothetical protein [candidate division Zixibacteria bacterium]